LHAVLRSLLRITGKTLLRVPLRRLRAAAAAGRQSQQQTSKNEPPHARTPKPQRSPKLSAGLAAKSSPPAEAARVLAIREASVQVDFALVK
jgi:hypothetical protein